MSSGRFTVIVIAVAVVAITAVVVANGGLPFGGDDDEPASEEAAAEPAPADEPEPEDPQELPDNPDEVRGTDSYALTRTANFREAMRVLDRRRRQVEGEFESIRVAPGRIDTVIVHPDDRRTNIQIRPDMKIAFDSTHDFPTQADFRDDGLRAGMLSEVDTTRPAALDRRRPPRQRRTRRRLHRRQPRHHRRPHRSGRLHAHPHAAAAQLPEGAG